MKIASYCLMIGLLSFGFHVDIAKGDVTLVQDGVPRCTIVVAADPIRSTCFAAHELQQHIQKITGAEVPIVRENAAITGLPIYVGESQKVRDLGLADKTFARDEYAVKFFPDCIVLTGPIDDANRVAADQSPDVPQPPEHLGYQRGPLHAVYDFLERGCDLRWYTPGELGMVCPTTKTLTVKTLDIHRQPAVKGRQPGWHCALKMWGDVSAEDERLFYLRNKAGGRYEHGFCHSFEGFPSRFVKGDTENPKAFESEHPEYFSKDQGPHQMCFSSPELLAQVIKDARDHFDGKGLKYRSVGDDEVYELVPRDTNIGCTCSRCQALLGPPVEGFNSGRASKLVWTFINNVAKALDESHPGKFIGALAYFDYAVPPEGMTIAKNVYVGPALGIRDWISGGGGDMELYKGWVKACPGHVRSLWLYPCSPGEATATRGYHHFPALMPHKLAEHMKMFTDDGVLSFNMCGSWELLECYLSLKYQDDPNRDNEAFIDEFFTRFYGSAAEPMKKIYLGIEAAYWDPKNYPDGHYSCDQGVCWGTLGSTERMAEWQRYMDEAKALAKTDIEKRRVALFDQSLWTFMKQGKEDWDFKAPHMADVARLHGSPPPSGTIGRTTAVADGDPSKVDWSTVTKLKIDRANDGFPSKNRTAELQMVHDGKYLYIHLHEFGDASKFTYEGWFFGNRWEVFYGPSRIGDQNTNATYLQLCLHVADRMDIWREPQLCKAIQYQSSNDAKGWNMKLSIPLANLTEMGGLKPGEKLYMNFIRGAFDGSSTLSLSPIFQVMYHCPARFAEFTLAQ